MPQGLISSGLERLFQYVTLDQIRAEGITVAEVPDDRALAMIRAFGHLINRLCDQWFLPVRLDHQVDSGGSSILRLPNQIPILDLFNVRVGRPDIATIDLPGLAFVRKQRYVMMTSPFIRLPLFPFFAQLSGVFGWLTDDFAPARMTLRAPVDFGDTVIRVSPQARLESNFQPGFGPVMSQDIQKVVQVGDTLLVGRDPAPFSGAVIVKSVVGPPDLDPRFGCDPVAFAVPVASLPVVRYGRVPDDIQRAIFLLIKYRIQAGSTRVGDFDIDEHLYGIGTRLTSESVEGYSYGVRSLPAVNADGGGAMTSGLAAVDDICQRYAAPNIYVGMV